MRTEYPYLDISVKPHVDRAPGHHSGMDKPPLRMLVADSVRKAMDTRPDVDTQQKLAKRAGVAQSHISRLLRGENVTLDVLEKVAHALRLEPFELVLNNDQAKLSLLGRIFGRDAPSDAETERLLRLPRKKARQ